MGRLLLHGRLQTKHLRRNGRGHQGPQAAALPSSVVVARHHQTQTPASKEENSKCRGSMEPSIMEHPAKTKLENPGPLALPIAPQVYGHTLEKILMDGGSSINILYYDAFHRMGLSNE